MNKRTSYKDWYDECEGAWDEFFNNTLSYLVDDDVTLRIAKAAFISGMIVGFNDAVELADVLRDMFGSC